MFDYPQSFDVLVVGGGHAGVEAALAAARMGCSTLLITMNPDTIGQMSCNPAIGGLAKGHLAREIDAIGGEMGINTDKTGIQFRMLNTKKGPAVWAPRAQCDKRAYQTRLKFVCEKTNNLQIHLAHTISIIRNGETVVGVVTMMGVNYFSKTVIITTGTFLRGLMHIGDSKIAGGRSGESSANNLTESLKKIGLSIGRLKTGTPPRLLKNSINFSKTEPQSGDKPAPKFSYWSEDLFHVEHDARASCGHDRICSSYERDQSDQLPCYVTRTSQATIDIVKRNIHKSPMYSGAIESVGPRYCPSIEDKIVRFASKETHQIFLEPEGLFTDEIYVNGFSTCLPFEVQIDLVKTIVGCENAQIIRPAYAVEYDFVFPTQLHHSLETKCCKNLFLAGQINGTSGYEEAGAQGIMSGINAARRVQGLPAVILRRDQAYIGVLIDDLVMKGTVEPYRMFTSRAEYRLLLRQDNADMRLASIGHEIGLLDSGKHGAFLKKKRLIEGEILRLRTTHTASGSLAQILKRPEVTYATLPGRIENIDAEVARQVEIEVKYAGYVDRQHGEVEKFHNMENRRIPENFDFDAVSSLRTEARQKLTKIRPENLGQASRISGVSPADISVLMVSLKRLSKATSMKTLADGCGGSQASCDSDLETGEA